MGRLEVRRGGWLGGGGGLRVRGEKRGGGRSQTQSSSLEAKKRKKPFSPSLLLSSPALCRPSPAAQGSAGGWRSGGGEVAAHEEPPCVIEKKSSEFSLDPHFGAIMAKLIPFVRRSAETRFLFFSSARKNVVAGQEDKSIDLYLSGRVNKSNLRRAGGGKMFSNLSRAAATMSVGSKAAIFFLKG